MSCLDHAGYVSKVANLGGVRQEMGPVIDSEYDILSGVCQLTKMASAKRMEVMKNQGMSYLAVNKLFHDL